MPIREKILLIAGILGAVTVLLEAATGVLRAALEFISVIPM
ncbi:MULTISPECIES: hypothetical protein [unclassified Vibrio]|nr:MULTISPECIES: hypothetical protein [unclassified Vibrio]